MISLEQIEIRGIPFANVTMDEALGIAENALQSKKQTVVHTPNSEIAQRASEEEDFRKIVIGAELILPDGAGILLASRILGTPLKQKVAGVEFGEHVLCLSRDKGYAVYFLGGKPGVAEAAKEKTEAKYPGLFVCGTHDGYFEKTGEENEAVLADIREKNPSVLFVCLGSPAQERWVFENRSFLPDSLVLCLGGSLDIYAGSARRAPKLFIALGLEWFYRLIKEPKRIGRMMKIPVFLWETAISKKQNEERTENDAR